MATAKKTTTAKSGTRRAATTKATATTTGNSTTATAEVGVKLPFDVRTLAADSAYATLGAGDRAVEVARELPTRLEELRKARLDRTAELVRANRAKAESFVKEAPGYVKQAPTKLQAELEKDLDAARKELGTFADRGRKVVRSITEARSTKRALNQTETARSQVKGAVTSIRKAVEQGQEAVGTAVGRIGTRRS